MAGLVVDIEDGLVARLVELPQLLASGGARGLVVVRVQTLPDSSTLLRQAELVIHGLRFLRGLEPLVEVAQGVRELRTDTVLLVDRKGPLNSGVGDGVAVGKVLGDDASARLLLLLDVVVPILGLFGRGRLVAGDLVDRLCGADLDRVGAELGVIQQERGLRGGGFLEGDRGRLRVVVGGCYRDVLNLAAEAEERLDLILRRLGGDVLDVYGGSHLCERCVRQWFDEEECR